jgi:DNA-binding FadR family transcriptional regulator
LWTITGSNREGASDLVETLKLIDLEPARLTADRATADDLKSTGTQLDAMEESIKDLKRFQEEDVNFHLAIGSAAHNQNLLNASHLIRNPRVREMVSTSFDTRSENRIDRCGMQRTL